MVQDLFGSTTFRNLCSDHLVGGPLPPGQPPWTHGGTERLVQIIQRSARMIISEPPMMHDETTLHLTASTHDNLERSKGYSDMGCWYNPLPVDIDTDKIARSVHETEGLTQAKDLCTPVRIHRELAEPWFKKASAMERLYTMKRTNAKSQMRSDRGGGFVKMSRKKPGPTKDGHATRWVGPGRATSEEAPSRDHNENKRHIVRAIPRRELYRCPKYGVRHPQ